MSRMLDDLGEFSTVDARPFALDIAARDVPHLLNDVVDTLVPIATDRGINLRVEAPPAGGPVLCDADRVLQVFSNVIGNAVKYSQRGGTITLRSAAKEGAVLFTVRTTARAWCRRFSTTSLTSTGRRRKPGAAAAASGSTSPTG